MTSSHVDVLIVGAGISGIDAAYHIQTSCPGTSYAICEARATLGGTWDLFRYPGIRSDSDMYTLGFPFRPWTRNKAIADGDSILAYIRETAEAYGIDRHIRYNHRVERASWADGQWTVEGTADGQPLRLTCKFLFLCSGYYDYDEGYTPEFAGRDRFRGTIVHPQHWPADLDYAGKRVVVIGSGATAVTLVPELAKRAAHVTMLQRSPTYIMSRPASDKIADWLRAKLPAERAYSLTRWKNVLLGTAFYQYCRAFPDHAKRLLVAGVKKMVPDVDVATHFTPRYNPWDQRLCLVPDADLFAALRAGTVSVVTDHIDSFTETGIALRSGQTLDADIIVTATGLKLKRFGGLALTVDGRPVEIPKAMVYRGMMLSDVPNLAFAVGYTNASWTLKCDLTSRFVCRLINHMAKRGYTAVRPRRDPSVREEPLLDFSSGYVQRSIREFPSQGSVVPWKLYQNYPLDLLLLGRARLADGVLQFS
ncbi:MAG TPA: NAD(P)/FAD-dependent oxidoreductase [Kofleriaceae bacterium]|nr:NAD(P)/FAD-dependent oxidoreductase [Kofleriaceae bacterium]